VIGGIRYGIGGSNGEAVVDEKFDGCAVEKDAQLNFAVDCFDGDHAVAYGNAFGILHAISVSVFFDYAVGDN